MFNKYSERCDVGWCFSRKIDCQGLIFLMGTWACLMVYSVCWLVRNRRITTQCLRSRLYPDDNFDEPFCEENQGPGYDGNGGVGMLLRPEFSLKSSDSLGSWTFRFWRCMGHTCAAFKWHLGYLLERVCTCFGLACVRITPESTGSVVHQSIDVAPCYCQAPDNSPGSHDHCEDAHLRGRPQPLALDLSSNLDSSFGSAASVVRIRSPTVSSAPGFFGPISPAQTSPMGSQTRTRARACPSSTPTSAQPSPNASKPMAAAASPIGISGCRVVSSSPRQTTLGRGYSHLSES